MEGLAVRASLKAALVIVFTVVHRGQEQLHRFVTTRVRFQPRAFLCSKSKAGYSLIVLWGWGSGVGAGGGGCRGYGVVVVLSKSPVQASVFVFRNKSGLSRIVVSKDSHSSGRVVLKRSYGQTASLFLKRILLFKLSFRTVVKLLQGVSSSTHRSPVKVVVSCQHEPCTGLYGIIFSKESILAVKAIVPS